MSSFEGEHLTNFQKEITENIVLQTEVGKEKEVNEHWTTLRDIIHNSAEVNVGCKKGKTPKKPSVTQEMVQEMEDIGGGGRELTLLLEGRYIES